MPPQLTTWSDSLHQTFRLGAGQSRSLVPFLSSDGLTPTQVLAKFPYDAARAIASGGGTGAPNPKRYRDAKQVYQAVGLAYEDDHSLLRITALGKATLRWATIINEANAVVLGRHAAYALSACQLRNPTGAGTRYGAAMEVFPFQFIWKAMLRLGGKISSDEINREILRTTSEADLENAILRIEQARNGAATLRGEVVTGAKKNDRIIPWLALASFGWTLFSDKDGKGFYNLKPLTAAVVAEASRIRHKHRTFPSTAAYVEFISDCACLPEDLR